MADEPDADVLDPEADDAPEEAAEPTAEEVLNAVASDLGWSPKDQWRGAPEDWRPATEFLKQTPSILRAAKKTAERLQGQQNRIVAEMAKMTQEQRERMDAASERALEEAIETGDTAKAKEIMDGVKASRAPAKEPALVEFEARNADWLYVDPEATDFAAALSARLQAQGVTGVAQLTQVEAAVKKRFPEHFEEADEPEPKGKEPKPTVRAPLVARTARTDTPANPGEVTAATLNRAQREAAALYNITPAQYAEQLNKIQKASR